MRRRVTTTFLSCFFVFLGCFLALASSFPTVFADPMNNDQLQAVSEYPNWVASQCSNATGGSASIGGDIKSLAQQVLDNKSITYDGGLSGPTATQFTRISNGQKSQTDDGREVDVEPIVLVAILHLAQNHKVQLSALTDGSSHTAPTNPHGKGDAVDIDFLDGGGTNGSDATAMTIINSVAEVLPSGARFGMGNNPFGTKQISGKTFSSFADFPTHVHVDVLGVSQADDDKAVQSATGSTASNTGGGGVFILGDSITVRSSDAYQKALQAKGTPVTIDASSSRSLTSMGTDGNKLSGFDAITADKDKLASASTIVVALGTNGDSTDRNIDKAMDMIHAASPKAAVYWIDTISVGRSDNYNSTVIGPANKAIYGQASYKYPYKVIPWFNAVDASGDPRNPSKSETDPSHYTDNSDGLGVHPTPSGSSALANLVAETIGVAQPAATSCCASGGSGSAALSGNNRAQMAFNFFVTNGYTPNQAAGIVGNMMYESGVDPHKVQGGGESSTPIGEGWGIVQFTPPSTALTLAASLHVNGPIGELPTQLEIVLKELQGPEKAAGDDVKSTSTYQEAVLAFQGNDKVGGKYHGFERPADESGTVSARTGYAHDILKNYGGGGGAGGDAATCGDNSASSVNGYKNPLRDIKNLSPDRIDQGVDYEGSGPVYAIGNGKVVNVTNSGWTGIGSTPTFIVYKLDPDAGPAHDKYVYFAEGCAPKVQIGDKVTSDTVICTMLSGNNSVETGWADGSRIGDAMAHDVWAGHDSTAYYTAFGDNFNQLLVKLGAPSGTKQAGAQELGSLPSGWPKWK